ncbi:MAG: neuromedin U [Gemmatimonadota bacterium]
MAVLAPIQVASQVKGDGTIEPGEDETAELARAVQNPVASMVSLPFQNNTTFDWGPQGGTFNVLNIQPVVPFKLSDGVNLITRTILPVITMPELVEGQGGKTGLGDLSFSAFLSPSAAGKIIWGAGPALLIPTATDDRLGQDQWALGPSLVVLTMPGSWVIGALVNNVWSIGGSEDSSINFFFSQVFANLNLSNGWYVVFAPIITANWEASDGNKWTVPFGGGPGKIFRLGSQPMNANVQVYYNAVRPGLVGRWGTRLQLQFMFPKR